ncbi:alpha/beta hydrolase [Orbaceae bacterium ESL0721]|nr:alpha/beta hydrolase [Orbaceae bacterium ESL0721]
MTHIQNLSEQLFKPKYHYPETSTLINRIDSEDYKSSDNNWYRVIDPLMWHFRGLPAIEVASVLARIAASTKPRSCENWLDTVTGYQSGNWSYEFLNQASLQSNIEEGETDKRQLLLLASRYCSLASFPHYKSDELALYAQTCAYKAYIEALANSPYLLKTLEFTFDANQNRIKTFLHLPISNLDKIEKAYPVVLLCGGMVNLQIDFYRYFSQYLAPKGIALLTVDFPSVGYSRAVNLSQNSSQIYQAVLEQITTVPWIDAKQVVIAGIGFGTNIATRLAYLAPNRIKGLLNINPLIHQLFVDKKLQMVLPAMYKDMLASRLGLSTTSNQQLSAELNYFSLKNQGIISRPCQVPVFNILFENDQLSTVNEAKLITSLKQNRVITVAKTPLIKNFYQAVTQSVAWILSIK